ncbi:MAG TPA: ATP synthase F1 subunit epsilon [Spirochaetota bacterium]|nr:ATP synthase F1 subunit epsilon [Spirochaetota bacterium]
MAMKLNCSVLTPDRLIYEGQVDFAVVEAFDGEMGFLFNHAPLISELGTGEIRLRTGDKADYFFVDGGFVEVKNNDLIILAETAQKRDELQVAQLESQITQLTSAEKPETWEERIKIDLELKKLKARLKVASK